MIPESGTIVRCWRREKGLLFCPFVRRTQDALDQMSRPGKLNDRSAALVSQAADDSERLRISVVPEADATILDFGVRMAGGIKAGLTLARICMADLANVELQAPGSLIELPQVFVQTDHPLEACLQSQYAGWKIATDDFFAMGSGPMRAASSTEEIFAEFPSSEDSEVCVGVLESGSAPTVSAIQAIRKHIPSEASLMLAVAPTASQAGNIQVVARSVETAMHKLHELNFPVDCVVSGTGAAPLPPVAKDDLSGIGRTNDAILYGSTVNLWVKCEDQLIEEIGPQTPSSSSSSHGQLFLKLFKDANHDFYALDKALFSPAVVIFHNLKTGRSFKFGAMLPELLRDSFGM